MFLHYINVFLCIMVMKLEAPIFSNQCMDDIKVNAGAADANEEASDSNGSSNRSHKHCRRLRSNQKGPSSSIYKGVVPQQNGHWGAQIYANHQRIWLGTFKSEIEAASAYDSAAIKLRSGDSYRNLPPTDTTRELEPSFQSNHTTEDILNMIKDGSYPVKFADFLRAQDTKTLGNGGESHARGEAAGQVCRELFQKELTPSDVGKLNRLVIPKKYAVKYFPHIEEGTKDRADGGEGEEGGHDTTLTFCDRTRRVWKFRYCYWKSSQSFVFTRGWNRFVKEKELKSKDIVSFYMVEANECQTSWMIDVNHGEGGGTANSRSTKESGHNSLIASEPKPEKGNSNADSNDKQPIEVEEATSKRKPVRLFGVDISCR